MAMLRPTIREADPDGDRDPAACAAIYAPFALHTATTFEEVPPTPQDMAGRMRKTHVWLVAELAGEVIGYAYAGPHKERASYRWAADCTVFLAEGHRGRGVGRALYEELFGRMRDRGLWMLVAGVTLPNDASVGLHRAMGFQEVGTYRRIGYKLGAWHDVIWLQLDLRPGDDSVPAQPRAIGAP